MAIKEKYIYLIDNCDMFAEKCIVEYDSKRIINMINNYSINSGAHRFMRKFFGNIKSYENGRILHKERRYNYRDNGKICGMSTTPIITYNCIIIENESDFIKALLDSFETFKLPTTFILSNFSKIYDMLINNKLNDKDINFLKELFDCLKITPRDKIISNDRLPYSRQKSEEIARKNSYVISFLNKYNN